MVEITPNTRCSRNCITQNLLSRGSKADVDKWHTASRIVPSSKGVNHE